MKNNPRRTHLSDKIRRFYADEIDRGLVHMAILLKRYEQIADFTSYHTALDTYQRFKRAASHPPYRENHHLYATKRLLESILTQLRTLAIELEGFASSAEEPTATGPALRPPEKTPQHLG